jgi:hypothetical protein
MKTNPIPDLTEPVVKSSNPPAEYQELITFVNGRFQSMRTQRQTVDRYWPLHQKQIDAIYRAYQDNRASSVVPLASALIEL